MSTKMTANDLDSSRSVASQIPRENQRVIYEYVHANGPVNRERIRHELFPHDRRAFEYSLAQLRWNDHLDVDGDTVRLAIDLETLGEPTTIDLADVETPVTIRPARQSDRATVVDLVREVAGDGIQVEAETVARRVASDKRLLQHDEDSIRVFFVATVDEEIRGWVHLTADTREQFQHTATLTGGVDESVRNAGVGSALLKRGLDWAAEQGYEKVYQHVPATNLSAIEFLKNRGWAVEARRDDYYRTGESYVDEILFAYATDS